MRVNSQGLKYTDPITNSNLVLFKQALEAKKTGNSVKSVVSQRKKQTARVVDIITAHQAGRIITALSQESSEFPPSLTKDGEVHQGDKADLVNVIMTDKHRYS